MKKIYFSLLIIVTVIIMLFTFIATLKPETYIGGVKPIVIGSQEIENIKPYSIGLVQELDSKGRQELKAGDIIVYTGYIEESEFIICEEITKVNDTTVTTGTKDKVFKKDLKINDIEGKVVATVIGSSFLVKILISTVGQILIILLYLSFIIWWIHRIIKRKK